jgi:proteasome lid subunit RPN8/RPN11
MREVICSAITVFSLLFSGLQIEATEELDSSPEVLNFFYQLFDDSAFGYDQTEEAGWIIAINGEYFLQKWPRRGEEYMQVWNASAPPHVVAIAHTHATSDIQKPSENDIALAKRIDLPVYTICRAGIWKADGEGVVVKIKPVNWFKEMKAKARAEKESKLKTR